LDIFDRSQSPTQVYVVPSDPVQALSVLAQLPPLPPRPVPRDIQSMNATNSRDPQLARQLETWLRTSTRALANTRVVDLAAAHGKGDSKTEKGASTSLSALYKTGTQLQVRACEVLTPRRFHEGTPMGHFTPAHISKVSIPSLFQKQKNKKQKKLPHQILLY
jgi:hypothetical protein